MPDAPAAKRPKALAISLIVLLSYAFVAILAQVQLDWLHRL